MLHIIKIINLPSFDSTEHPKVGGAFSTGSSIICINRFFKKFTIMVAGRHKDRVNITDVPLDAFS